MKKISLFTYYLISFIYMEFLLKILLKTNIFTFNSISTLAFCIVTALFVFILTKLFSEKTNKIICFSVMFLFTVWFCAQFIVKDVFSFYVDFNLTATAGSQVTDSNYIGETIAQILKRSWIIIVYFIPFVLGLIFKKKMHFGNAKFAKILILLVFFALSIGLYIGTLQLGKNKDYSAYELVYKTNDTQLNAEKLGIFNTFYLDIQRHIFGFNENLDVDPIVPKKKKEPQEKVYDYNTLDIDFDKMLLDTKDSTVKSMTEYFMSDIGTQQNDYTGLFKDKNLIYIMAESFNEIAVNETLTPTLYKLIHEGFDFKDFYSPTIFSTIGGEMQELTGLYPSAYGTFKAGTTTYPMGLANIFKDAGYNTFAYHNSSYTFQGRNKYLKALGFDNFKGCNNGMEKIMSCSWLASDIEMIDATLPEYAESENPFMVFYATVSGHGSWTWASNNIANKYYENVKNMNFDYPQTVQAYMAAQIELDRALEELINKLTEYGILDDTVIVLGGDHYPYMLTESTNAEEINFFTKTLGKDLRVEINHSNLIIWNSTLEHKEINKVASTIDILPTVYNLFSMKYDSRLYIGRDIFSNDEGLAMFGDRSWVTNKGTYNVGTGRFTLKEGIILEDETEYIKQMNNVVKNKIKLSENLIKKDYYKLAWNYLKTPSINITNIEEEQE